MEGTHERGNVLRARRQQGQRGLGGGRGHASARRRHPCAYSTRCRTTTTESCSARRRARRRLSARRSRTSVRRSGSMRGLTTGFVPFSHAFNTLFFRARMVSVRYSVAFGSEYFAVSTIARMASSGSAATMRAAQNRSSGRAFSNAAFGYSGFQRSGSKWVDSIRPTAGMSGYDTLIQGRTYNPNVNIVIRVGRASQRYSLPARGLCAWRVPLPSVDPKSRRL